MMLSAEPITIVVSVVTAVISIIASLGAFAAWMLRHMDRRFAEAKADTQRQFDEVQRQFDRVQQQLDGVQGQFDRVQQQFDGVQQRFDGVQGQFDGVQGQFDGVQGQFAEFRAEMQRGFDQAREDRLRLERKMENKFDAHGEQIANLREDVGRLQGIVERTYQSQRFTVLPAQSELSAGDGVREPRTRYRAGDGGEDAEHDGKEAGHGDDDAGSGGKEAEDGGEDPALGGQGAGSDDVS